MYILCNCSIPYDSVLPSKPKSEQIFLAPSSDNPYSMPKEKVWIAVGSSAATASISMPPFLL